MVQKVNQDSVSMDAYMYQGLECSLEVKFDPDVIVLFKEVRNLSWLGYQADITMDIRKASDNVKV